MSNLKQKIREILDKLYWQGHLTGLLKIMPNDEQEIYSALTAIMDLIEKEKQKGSTKRDE